MQSMGDPMAIFEHSYAELPAYLAEQQQEMARYLKEASSDG